MSAKRINDDEFIDSSGEDAENGRPCHRCRRVGRTPGARGISQQSSRSSSLRAATANTASTTFSSFRSIFTANRRADISALVLNTWTGKFRIAEL